MKTIWSGLVHFDDRVRGFAYGYRNRFGTAKDFFTNDEFRHGWEEGAGLRLDELRAQAQADLRKAKP